MTSSEPSSKKILVWIAAGAAIIFAIFVGIGILIDAVSEVKTGVADIYDALARRDELALRDIKAVFEEPLRSGQLELRIEAVSNKALKDCAADLDTGGSSYRSIDNDGKEAKFDVGPEGLVVAIFAVPQVEISSSLNFRLRCDKYKSPWTLVDMHNVAH
jgi:hypothetical protein